jgi:hypothetical protein
LKRKNIADPNLENHAAPAPPLPPGMPEVRTALSLHTRHPHGPSG